MGDIGNDPWICTEHSTAEALVDFFSDRIVGQSSKALQFAVLQICVNLAEPAALFGLGVQSVVAEKAAKGEVAGFLGGVAGRAARTGVAIKSGPGFGHPFIRLQVRYGRQIGESLIC